MSIRPKPAKIRAPIRALSRKDQDTNFLRNEFRCRVMYLGRRFYSVEHAFLAARSMDRADHRLIAECVSIRKARQRATQITKVRPLWDDHKPGIMLGILESKFEDPILAKQLLETIPQPIVYESTDLYWGYQWKYKRGQNMLGQLLMLVRDNLRRKNSGGYARWRAKETARIKDWRRRRREEAARSRLELAPLPPLPRSRRP